MTQDQKQLIFGWNQWEQQRQHRFTHPWPPKLWYPNQFFFFFFKCKVGFLWFPCAPPNPTTHHSFFTHLFIPLAGSLPYFSFLYFSPFHFRCNTPLHSFKLFCRHLHITISTIIFPTRSPENFWEPINTFTSFFWGKNFSSFWWVLHFCLRLFLSKF